MQIGETEEQGVAVVIPEGRLDSSTARDLETRLMAKLESTGAALVLDLGALEFVSSAGLRVFLVVAKRTKAEGRGFALCAVQPQVQSVFDVSGFARILPIEPDRESALAKLAPA